MIMTTGAMSSASSNLVPLTASTCDVLTVQKIAGPEQRRLCELGFIEGAKLEVVNRARRDMMVVKVGGARLALSRAIADSVWVR